jgi:hypothetical protein
MDAGDEAERAPKVPRFEAVIRYGIRDQRFAFGLDESRHGSGQFKAAPVW